MNTPIYNRKNEAPADGWYQIEVSGTHPVGDGRRQVIDETALKSIVNRFQKEAEQENFAGILVDADHLSHDLENPTAALAWLKEVDIRNGELHGRLELTDLGEQAVKGKRYKWFSTEYSAADLEALPDNAVRPLRLAGLAFTNRPNNKGAKPISNRDGTMPTGETTPNHNTNTQTMKTIAEKLGLSAEATEADCLTAIEDLLKKVANMETKDAEAQADVILNRLGTRVPEAVRPQWREQLIANRAGAEKLMEASFPAKPAEPRIFNREGAKPAVAELKTADDKADAQAALVNQIRNRDRCTHTQAWDAARRESPEIFN
jgi:Mu-like prophage I protein